MMENINKGDWEANNNLVNELTRGKELARQLQMHLQSNVGTSSSQETCEYLVQKILVSFEKGISLLSWPPNPAAAAGDQPQPLQHGAGGSGGGGGGGVQISESPPSLAGSPRSDQDSDRDQERDASRKRYAVLLIIEL